MCCTSREPAQNFKQYIDTTAGTGKYIPLTLEDHWNSDHMKSVRKRMLAGEILPECEVCNNKLLNTDVYRSYFNNLFSHKYNEVLENTDKTTGYTTMKPVSWDYRFSNLCNYKCRTCGDMLSSSWETEQRQHNMIDWHDPKNHWMQPDVKTQIEQFQSDQIEKEFSQAVEEHRVEEIYWVGGEPLMYEQHWRYMQRIIELGDGPNVYARYNTNLSRVKYKGIDLYNDILSRLGDWQICASLDGTGKIGEYIRTGLNYDSWYENFRKGVEIQRHRRQMRIDFTLTLPGMFEIINIQRLAEKENVDVLSKVVFSLSPNIILSPLSLPKTILHPWIDEILNSDLHIPSMRDILVQLKSRPTFQEEWPEQYQKGLYNGKKRILHLEKIRTQSITLEEILAQKPELLKWWNQIEC
jgi:hypothetical protein